MSSLPPKRQPDPILSTGAGTPMSQDQCALLRKLAFDAFEPEAFNEHLTQTEAAMRIAMLQAKRKLMDEPPHTL
jgi:hypothetical protein